MNDDPIELVGALAPPTTPDDRVLTRVRSTLMDTIDEAAPSTNDDLIAIDGRPGRRRRKRRRIAPIAAIAVVLAGATGTAWAVLGNRNSAETTTLSCPSPAGPHADEVDEDAQTIIPAVSGDPVVDCTAHWRTMTSAEPPKMKAYDNGRGGVVVLAADAAAPKQYRALAPGEYQHADAATLQRNLDDVAVGLEARCYDLDGAKKLTDSMLDALGMKGWKVEQAHPGRAADGKRNCASAGVDAATRTVMILGAGPGRIGTPYRSFAEQLHRTLDSSCLGIDQAEARVQTIASRTTVDVNGQRYKLIDPHGVSITKVPSPDTSCTSVTVTVGGGVSVTLEGPEQPSGSGSD